MISYGFLSQCWLILVSEGEFQVGCCNKKDVHPLDPPQASDNRCGLPNDLPKKTHTWFFFIYYFQKEFKNSACFWDLYCSTLKSEFGCWAKGFKSEDGKIKVLVLKQSAFLRIVHIIPQTLEVYNNVLTSLVFHQSL